MTSGPAPPPPGAGSGSDDTRPWPGHPDDRGAARGTGDTRDTRDTGDAGDTAWQRSDGRGADHRPGGHTTTARAREGARATARGTARGVRATARGTARGVNATARVTGRFGRFAVGQAKRAAEAEGADTSGLNRLFYLHAANAAGDAAVAISLATTVFFAGATSDARGQVALFLGLTMLPFAIVAPLIGPFLDRFSHGRRWAIGATFAIRAFLCWVLAGAVADDSALLYPAALGVLVSSKAYGVTRAAAVPRLLPDGFTLVRANGRVGLAGLVGAGVSAPLAGLAALAGAPWSLRYAFAVFVVGTVAAILLPARVDSSEGEARASLGPAAPGHDPDEPTPAKRRGTQIPPQVAFALRANLGPRWLSGFLTMYMAFLLRDNPLEGWEDRQTLLLGIVIGGAAAGNALGILLASLLRRINPSVTVTAALLADVGIVALGTLFYGLLVLFGLGLVAGLAQSLGKLSLDSTIQDRVPVSVQASAFARSDTTLQLAWVVGGFVGIALPQVPRLGLGIALAVLGAWTLFVLGSRPRARRRYVAPPPGGRATTDRTAGRSAGQSAGPTGPAVPTSSYPPPPGPRPQRTPPPPPSPPPPPPPPGHRADTPRPGPD